MLGEAFGSIGAGVGNLVIGGGGLDQYRKALEVIKAVQEPTFDTSKLTPEQWKVVAQYAPDLYQEKAPEEVKNLVDSPAMQQAQYKALGQLQEVADKGLGEADRLAAIEAQNAMQMQQRRGTESALQDLAARGRLGGGTEMRARIGAGQQAAEMGRGMGSDLQRQAIQNRLNAITQSGNLAGEIRGQNVDTSRQAAEIINRYNLANRQLSAQTGLQNAQMQNQANLWNAQNQQNTGNQNTQLANQFKMYNQQYPNQMNQQAFQNAMGKANALSGAYNQFGWAKDAERQGKINALAGIGSGIGGLGDTVIGGGGGGGGGLGILGLL
jgi:hypothetical protein